MNPEDKALWEQFYAGAERKPDPMDMPQTVQPRRGGRKMRGAETASLRRIMAAQRMKNKAEEQFLGKVFSRPVGSQFVGARIVPGSNIVPAAKFSGMQGLPSTTSEGYPVSGFDMSHLTPEDMQRLMEMYQKMQGSK